MAEPAMSPTPAPIIAPLLYFSIGIRSFIPVQPIKDAPDVPVVFVAVSSFGTIVSFAGSAPENQSGIENVE